MTRSLDDLDSRIKPLIFELIARCAERGIPVFIVDVLRTAEEQADNIARGVSWTSNSKHLPQPPDRKSMAIDLCPYSQYALYGPDKLEWNAEAPAWQIMGTEGENLGLRWGGRWAKKDMGHFELDIT